MKNKFVSKKVLRSGKIEKRILPVRLTQALNASDRGAAN